MRRSLVLGALIMGTLLALTGSAAGAARLYVPDYGSGPPEVIGGFDLGTDGSLTPVPGSPFAAVPPLAGGPSGLNSIAFAPDGGRMVSSYLFSGGVQGLAVSSAGAVTPAGAPLGSASQTGLAVTPDGRFAYVSTREFGSPAEGIRAYAIAADGALAAIPMASGSHEFSDIAITPDGRFAYASDYTANQVLRFAINADGTLTAQGSTGLSAAPQLVVSPNGKLLLVAVEGSGVASYAIAGDGSLSANGPPALTGDTSMKYFAVAADSGHIYMPDGNVDAVVTASIAADGKLSVIGSTPIEDPEAVVASPNGRFLYAYHRGSVAGISSAAIGADGAPTFLPFNAAWDAGEPARLVFQPEAAPTASFSVKAGAPGSASKFNASQSVRAARYEWDFGDGTVLVDGGVAPEHAYAGAGIYQVTLTVIDQQGCSTRQVYTGQSTTCPGGPEATQTTSLDTPPAITGLKVSNRKFAVAAAKRKGARSARVKLGTVFRYRLSEAAKVRFKIDRKLPGRVVGGKCRPLRAANKKRKHCVRFKKASPPVNAKGKQGANKTRYSGRRKGGKALVPGAYRATAVATDGAGGRSVPRFVSFKILAR